MTMPLASDVVTVPSSRVLVLVPWPLALGLGAGGSRRPHATARRGAVTQNGVWKVPCFDRHASLQYVACPQRAHSTRCSSAPGMAAS